MTEPRLDLATATTNDAAHQVPLVTVTSEEEVKAQLIRKATGKQQIMEKSPAKPKNKNNPSQKKRRTLKKKEMAVRIQQDTDAIQ